MIYAIVPVKELSHAKGRLAGFLTPQERRGLVLAMLTDVLGALAGARDLAGYGVISRDPAALALAAEFEADVLPDRAADLNGALTQAAAAYAALGASATLALPADLPLLTAADIDVLTSAGPARGIVLAPARDGGTNALLTRPPLALPFLFGSGSMARHADAARSSNLPLEFVRTPGLSLDIDQPDDLRQLVEYGSATAAGRFVRGLSLTLAPAAEPHSAQRC